jgi:hypothetical protein
VVAAGPGSLPGTLAEIKPHFAEREAWHTCTRGADTRVCGVETLTS